jgi:hypothetical protein
LRDTPNGVRGYSCFSAGKYPTEKQRSGLMYHDFDHLLARERTAQMRKEVDSDRLARLAQASRSDEDGVTRRGTVARGAALLTALFR